MLEAKGPKQLPLGVRNLDGLLTVGPGGNGAAPTNHDYLADAIEQLATANAMTDNLAAVWHPRTANQFAKLKDSQNQPLVPPEPVAALRKFSSKDSTGTNMADTPSPCSPRYYHGNGEQ